MTVVKRLAFCLTLIYGAVAQAAVTVSVNGVSHTIPQTGEKGWGTNVTAWIQAISANTLQPSGGTFTLTADTNFGANYGLVSTYYKSRSSNISGAGALRLANTDTIGWRNNANSSNLLLSVDSSDRLLFNGTLLPSLSASDFSDSGFRISDDGDASKKIAFQASGIGTSQTRTITVPDSDVDLGGLTNSNIAVGASIAYSKLAIAAGDIPVAKIASLTADRAVVTNSTGVLSAAATTATQIGYISTLTSDAQTQLDAKVAKSLVTTKGDIIAATASATPARVAVGADGLFLKADSGATAGVSWASPAGAGLSVVSKTTTYTAATSDDVILASGSAFTITLYAASGNSGKVLRIKKTDSSLTNVITIDGNSSETIDGALTTTLNTQYEELTIICDGSNWHILDRSYPSVWVAYTPTFTGFGTVSGVSFYSRRVGDSLEVHGVFTSGTSTAVQAQITLGFNGTNANVTSAGTTKISSSFLVVGSGAYATAAASNFYAVVQPSVGYLNFGLSASGSAGFAAANGSALLASGQVFSFYATVPISGWN